MSGFFDKVKSTYNATKTKAGDKYNSVVKKGGEYASNLSEKLGKAKEELGYIGKKHGEHVASAGAGAGIALGVVYRREIAEGLRGIYEAGKTGLSTNAQALKDISYAVSIPTGAPQFLLGLGVGVAATEAYERGGGKAIKKLMKTRKGAIAKEFGKKAGEEYENVIKEIAELERKNRGFEKAYNRAFAKGLKGATEMKKIAEDYESFKEENGERYDHLTKVVKDFNKQYSALERGGGNIPVIIRNRDGTYSTKLMGLSNAIEDSLADTIKKYEDILDNQKEEMSKLTSSQGKTERQEHYNNFKKLEGKATKLRESLEMTYAQLEAVEKRADKRAKKSRNTSGKLMKTAAEQGGINIQEERRKK